MSTQLPLQALGVQHCALTQTPLFGHVCGHATVWPQLFVTETWHCLPHALALSGVQHWFVAARQTSFDGHAVVPPSPQFTVRPQLFVACPHCCVPHVFAGASGMHPQAPLKQVTPAAHDGHATPWPQLSVVPRQRPAHQLGSDWQAHTFDTQA